MEVGRSPEEGDDSIATALQEVSTDGVKSQVANVLATILDKVEKCVDQLSEQPPLVLNGEYLPWCTKPLEV